MYIFISLSIYTRVFVALVHIGRVHLSGVHFFSHTPITDLWGQRLCLAQWENMHSTIFCHKSFVGSIKCRTFFNSAHRGLTCPMLSMYVLMALPHKYSAKTILQIHLSNVISRANKCANFLSTNLATVHIYFNLVEPCQISWHPVVNHIKQ